MSANDDGIVVGVTGAAGYLGSTIVSQLLSDHVSKLNLKIKRVKAFDLRTLPESFLKSHKEAKHKLYMLIGDINNMQNLRQFAEGCDVIIHSAGLVNLGDKSDELLEKVNVNGTQAVLRIAKELNIKYVVYTSSATVVSVFNGNSNVDPDNKHYPSKDELIAGSYGYTKQQAEKLVLGMNNSVTDDGKSVMYTAAIRPANIFGENDPYYTSNLLDTAASGQYKAEIGTEKKPLDHMYVGNCAWCHICAVNALINNPKVVGGRAFYPTHGGIRCSLGEFTNQLLPIVGAQPPTLKIPLSIMAFIAMFFDLYKFVGTKFTGRPVKVTLSSEVLQYIAYEQTFNGDSAKNDLGFTPLYSAKETIERTSKHYRKIYKEARRRNAVKTVEFAENLIFLLAFVLPIALLLGWVAYDVITQKEPF